MEDHEIINKYTPPRAIDSITTGFQIASHHIYLILFPVVLDLILWLGPKLRVKDLFLSLFQNFLTSWSALLTETTNSLLVEAFQQNLEGFLNSFNLLSAANTFPIGVPALLGSGNSLLSPFGATTIAEVGTVWNFLAIWIGLSLLGIILGSLYFREVAFAAKEQQDRATVKKQHSLFKQTINASLFMGLLVLAASIALVTLLFIVSFIALISPGLAQFVLLVGLVTGTWLAIPLMFGAHSIYLYDQPFVKSMISGYQIMGLSFRYRVSQKEALFTLPKSVSFVLLMYILYEGLNLLWRVPDASSILLLVGIFGHAFIYTALLVSSFHYFSQIKLWQENLKTAQQKVSVFNQ